MRLLLGPEMSLLFAAPITAPGKDRVTAVGPGRVGVGVVMDLRPLRPSVRSPTLAVLYKVQTIPESRLGSLALGQSGSPRRHAPRNAPLEISTSASGLFAEWRSLWLPPACPETASSLRQEGKKVA